MISGKANGSISVSVTKDICNRRWMLHGKLCLKESALGWWRCGVVVHSQQQHGWTMMQPEVHVQVTQSDSITAILISFTE